LKIKDYVELKTTLTLTLSQWGEGIATSAPKSYALSLWERVGVRVRCLVFLEF